MIRDVAPELDHAEPGKLDAHKVPSLRDRHPDGHGRTPGMLNFGDIAGAARDEHFARLE